MSFKKGDIVKAVGNIEPCIVYRVMADEETVIDFFTMDNPDIKTPMNHTFIEVIGFFPTIFLEKANMKIVGNRFALDVKLGQHGQLN